jgi:hypothetical protein
VRTLEIVFVFFNFALLLTNLLVLSLNLKLYAEIFKARDQ